MTPFPVKKKNGGLSGGMPGSMVLKAPHPTPSPAPGGTRTNNQEHILPKQIEKKTKSVMKLVSDREGPGRYKDGIGKVGT